MTSPEYYDKLKLLDAEIRTLHDYCVQKNVRPEVITEGAQCLLQEVDRYKRKRFATIAAVVSVLVAIVAGLVYYEPAAKFITVQSRLLSIKLLPYFDWTRLHSKHCLVENPYYIGQQLVDDDCELCENLAPTVPVLTNASPTSIAENYLKQDRPFVVKDAMADWDAMTTLNLHFLYQLYESEQRLREFQPCMFKTNLRLMVDSPRVVLKKYAGHELQNFYAHWENCDWQSARILRQFYRRPYFVPRMVEMAETNWLFIASQYTSQQFKPADIGLPMMWLAVVRGEMKVALTPRPPCKKICPQLYVHLKKGEILVATELMWMLDYTPLVATGELVAIGGGGYFD